MTIKKVALIFGITGQDGSLLAEYLILKKKYIVHGVKRRSSSFNTERIDNLYKIYNGKKLYLHYGDITDTSNVINIINKIKPNEIYNLAAQSHVKVSFETPEYTANADALGTLRILEAIRICKLKKTKFYQASTSEMFGNSKAPQNENTNFQPVSPYGTAKLYSYWITRNYRSAYGLFASNGILFNHEGTRRGETFVTRKITMGVANILKKKQSFLKLGNLESKRDWGDARDYVIGMHKILQYKRADDFVLSTEKCITVRKFVEIAFRTVGINLIWKGKGVKEIGINKKNKKILVKIDKNYYRPNEIYCLLGSAKKAKKLLKWKPTISLEKMIKDMVMNDLKS